MRVLCWRLLLYTSIRWRHGQFYKCSNLLRHLRNRSNKSKEISRGDHRDQNQWVGIWWRYSLGQRVWFYRVYISPIMHGWGLPEKPCSIDLVRVVSWSIRSLNGRRFSTLRHPQCGANTVKPVFKGHSGERTPCDKGTFSQNNVLSCAC